MTEPSSAPKPRTPNLWINAVIGSVIGIGLAGGLVFVQHSRDSARSHDLRAQALGGPSEKLGGPFTLTNQDGARVSLSDFAGKAVLLSFGFTFCPDICPTSLQDMALAADSLPEKLRDRLQLLFITIDPARDTPAALKNYVTQFHPALQGLTGTAEEIKSVADAYRVYYAKAQGDDSSTEYMMDHTTLIYLLGPDGQYVRGFRQNTRPEDMAAAIAALLPTPTTN